MIEYGSEGWGWFVLCGLIVVEILLVILVTNWWYRRNPRKRKSKGWWECENCGNVEYYEREVICWECGDGEMVYRDGIHCPDCGKWGWLDENGECYCRRGYK